MPPVRDRRTCAVSLHARTPARRGRRARKLAADAEAFDDRLVTGVVVLLDVVEELASLRNELQEATAGMVVLDVGLEVPGEIGDAFRKDRDLHFGGAGVAGFRRIFGDERLLALCSDRHRSSFRKRETPAGMAEPGCRPARSRICRRG